MKYFKLAAIFTVAMAGSHSAMALDIQPGEWVMESQGTAIHLCYTEKMAADSKKIAKGFETTADGCTTKFTESTDTLLVNETTCDKPEAKMHTVVETKKISDTEFHLTMKMDMDNNGQKMSTSSETVQKFVGKACSEASQGKVQK